jgi:hypothetical protein
MRILTVLMILRGFVFFMETGIYTLNLSL